MTHRCLKCKTDYTTEAFDKLPAPRNGEIQEAPAGANPRTEPAFRLLLRDCPCGSTISRVLDITLPEPEERGFRTRVLADFRWTGAES